MKMFQVAWCGPSSSLGALGARVVKVGTAIGPTGRHTGRCTFFMAFSREYEIIQPSEGTLIGQLSRVFHELQCLRLTLYPMSQCGFLVEALMSPEMDQMLREAELFQWN